MRFFVSKETDRIDLGDGYWVDIKRRMSYGDQQKLVAHFIKFGDPKNPDIDLSSGNIVLLELNIVDWNLVDESGKKVPVSREAIEQLEPEVANKIAEEINRRNTPPKA